MSLNRYREWQFADKPRRFGIGSGTTKVSSAGDNAYDEMMDTYGKRREHNRNVAYLREQLQSAIDYLEDRLHEDNFPYISTKRLCRMLLAAKRLELDILETRLEIEEMK